MKQQQDGNREPQGTPPRQRPQDQDGQSSANQGGRQDQSKPDRSRDQTQDQPSPEGQGRERQPGSDTSDPGVDQDADSAGIGKEGQGGQSQRPQNPARER
jgi:hypothetical protein